MANGTQFSAVRALVGALAFVAVAVAFVREPPSKLSALSSAKRSATTCDLHPGDFMRPEPDAFDISSDPDELDDMSAKAKALSDEVTNVIRQSAVPDAVAGVRVWRRPATNPKTGTQPAVRLSTYPDTGTTWMMQLLEDATGIATQVPNDTIGHGDAEVYAGKRLYCRAECGIRKFTAPLCQAGSAEAEGVRLAMGEEKEVFKNHFPASMFMLYETDPPMPETILIVRNPLDGRMASLRHRDLQDLDKVEGESGMSRVDRQALMVSGDLGVDAGSTCNQVGTAPLRYVTSGMGVQPKGMDDYEWHFFARDFQEYLTQWVYFLNFWFTHKAASHTRVTMVRYEDLNTNTEHVLQKLISESGLTPKGDLKEAAQRATEAHPSLSTALQRDIYFNTTLARTPRAASMARTAMRLYPELMEALGYHAWIDEMAQSYH
eukprot:NODE_6291_length_1685_cov_3.989089.p1 GENE.NODE_6291_length_1685_cov_3.989089~~NODE_6291_length_1685_cov_3.989089.p1  ORF type:complete len:459 (+),score=114.25 NODE_6291_length_1685_cov_3.989089:80-1378(+)